MKILFAITLGITILVLIKFISIIVGKRELDHAGLRIGQSIKVLIVPDSWWIFYPCFFYQVYWWCSYLNLI
jgi:hypothetical protein